MWICWCFSYFTFLLSPSSFWLVLPFFRYWCSLIGHYNVRVQGPMQFRFLDPRWCCNVQACIWVYLWWTPSALVMTVAKFFFAGILFVSRHWICYVVYESSALVFLSVHVTRMLCLLGNVGYFWRGVWALLISCYFFWVIFVFVLGSGCRKS